MNINGLSALKTLVLGVSICAFVACGGPGPEVRNSAPGPLLHLKASDLGLKRSAESTWRTKTLISHKDQCTVLVDDGDKAPRPVVLGVNRTIAYEGTKSALLDVSLMIIDSPDCAVKARLEDPVKTTDIGGIIRGTATLDVAYTCARSVVTNKRIRVRSDSRLLATSAECSIKHETLIKSD